MAVKSQTVTVTDEPTKLNAEAEADWGGGQSIVIRNTGEASIWIGDDDVTPSDGFELPVGDVISLDLAGKSNAAPAESIYGVASSTPIDVTVMQVGV